jgi:hypothetical protein
MKLASYTLCVSLAGCSGPCGDQATQARTSLPSSKAPPIPSFRADILPVMALHCASAEGCHGNKPTPSVSLDLSSSGAYAELVNKPSEGRRGAVRVKPGEPQASFLVDKLTGRLGPAQEGKRMPIDVDTGAPVVPSPLPPDFIEQVLEPWIAAGGPNN